ncbi:GNAT family N-acetyltransferase [Nitrogeniibacter mangrovi]|uniref:GNAT family N-acetyltransferase n=2 Tax=Nitrogeniibacter mangrovi TaxID=2016596 RepID=A0A6C1B8Y4_9RHOO|nr:GNAT family N-acetyltransferase [Nitrogeniibacter mangrovi]
MATVDLRRAHDDDLPVLWALFQAAVHRLTSAHYTAAQQVAWAPAGAPPAAWLARVRANAPWVARRSETIVGFADLQADGRVDMFFVAPEAAGTGVGRALMQRLIAQANDRGLVAMHADVSLTAEPFFRHFGFRVIARHTVIRRGVSLRNARMALSLGTS